MTLRSSNAAGSKDAAGMALPFDDREDFDEARRGLIAPLSSELVRATDGRVAWDLDSYSFLDAECPETVNPSLWRQAQLLNIHGLFEVAPGFYQVRGMDLSNMTIVEGDEGVLVMDPLISVETAAAALALYREHRGDRPVTALLYTHSHIDHFGGARGVVSAEEVESGKVPVIAPERFVEHAVSENLLAGTAMARRATYMYGALLERGPKGQVTAGLGLTTSSGTISLIPPTLDITRTGQEFEVDGIRMSFQMTPGAEAPAEMNFLFPEHRVFCVAENATHNLHNILTLRGAEVRSAQAWSRYLNEAIELFGEKADVMFAQHHWPRWGADRIVDFLAKQRDLYAYLHDQTLRLLNQGYVGEEIAEMLEMPPGLEKEWHCRGYYGSISHNVKAIYQRYMGWFDGNPAHLWRHPSAELATRYVELAGGAEAALEAAGAAFEGGDYRWAAEVSGHVVFADPANGDARELQARTFEQLAQGAENATWRNFFLMGAKELREGSAGTVSEVPADFIASLTIEQILDSLAVRIDGPRAAGESMLINWSFPDAGERYAVTLSNGALTHVAGKQAQDPDAAITINRPDLDAMLADPGALQEVLGSGRVQIEGDAAKLARLLGLLDEPDPGFAIVTP